MCLCVCVGGCVGVCRCMHVGVHMCGCVGMNYVKLEICHC